MPGYATTLPGDGPRRQPPVRSRSRARPHNFNDHVQHRTPRSPTTPTPPSRPVSGTVRDNGRPRHRAGQTAGPVAARYQHLAPARGRRHPPHAVRAPHRAGRGGASAASEPRDGAWHQGRDHRGPLGRAASLKLYNNFVRWVWVYVQYLKADGTNLSLNSNSTFPDTKHATSLGLLPQVFTVLGVPLWDTNTLDATLTFPTEATSARLLFCGLGNNSVDGGWRQYFPADAYDADHIGPRRTRSCSPRS